MAGIIFVYDEIGAGAVGRRSVTLSKPGFSNGCGE